MDGMVDTDVGHQGRGLVLVAACLGVFVVVLDTTIVSNALPTIQGHFGLSNARLAWIADAYLLVIASLVITGGRLGDLYGRRRLFVAGIGIFALGSVLSGAAPSSAWLLGSRAFQGVGAALIAPLSLSIINDAFPPTMRGRAIGAWAASAGAALSVGLVLGGLLTQDLSWRWVFYVNVPIAAVVVVVTLRAVGESRDPTASRRLDFGGILTVTGGLFGVVLATVQGRQWGWGSWETTTCFAGGLALLVLFVIVERVTLEPLVPLSLFRDRTFSAANGVAVLVSFGYAGTLYFVPLYMQDLRGYGPITSGVTILPLTLAIALTAPVAGLLVDRVGSRWPMSVGLFVMAVGFVLLGRTTMATSYGSLVGPLVLVGLGIGLVLSPMSAAVMGSAPAARAGAASGILDMNRHVGGVFGIAVLGAFFSASANRQLQVLLGSLTRAQRTWVVKRFVPVLDNPKDFAAALAHVSPTHAAAVVQGTHQLFLSGFVTITRVAAVVSLLGAVAAAGTLRRQAAANLFQVRTAPPTAALEAEGA
jgi:EmrB/QacA subfamily drug resistance transporter